MHMYMKITKFNKFFYLNIIFLKNKLLYRQYYLYTDYQFLL
jgi:hypothetical protein